MTETALARLLAKEEIRDRMLSYARAVDRRDWELMRATFHPDAEVHHAEYRGGVEGLVATITGRQDKVTVTLHLFTNCLVEFAADGSALVETYLLAHQWLDAEGTRARGRAVGEEGLEIESWGRYLDVFTLKDGAWRVQRRTTVFESQTLRPALGRRVLGADWPKARGDGEDPLWVERRRLGLAPAQ